MNSRQILREHALRAFEDDARATGGPLKCDPMPMRTLRNHYIRDPSGEVVLTVNVGPRRNIPMQAALGDWVVNARERERLLANAVILLLDVHAQSQCSCADLVDEALKIDKRPCAFCAFTTELDRLIPST